MRAEASPKNRAQSYYRWSHIVLWTVLAASFLVRSALALIGLLVVAVAALVVQFWAIRRMEKIADAAHKARQLTRNT